MYMKYPALSNKKCDKCGAEKKLTRHHIIPKRVKKSLRNNVSILCRTCHDLIDKQTFVTKIGDNLYEIISPYGKFTFEVGYEIVRKKKLRKDRPTKIKIKIPKKKKINKAEAEFNRLYSLGVFKNVLD